MKCHKFENLQLLRIIEFPNCCGEFNLRKLPLYFRKGTIYKCIYVNRCIAKTLRIYAYTQLPLFLPFSLFLHRNKGPSFWRKKLDFFLLCLKAENRNSAEENYIQTFTCAKITGWLPRKIVCPHIVLTSDCHNFKSVWLEL